MSQLRRLLQSLIVVGLVFGLSGFANAQSTSTNVLTQQKQTKEKEEAQKSRQKEGGEEEGGQKRPSCGDHL